MSILSERSKKALPFSMEEFINPPSCFKPTYAWCWNDKITEEGIREQLDAMAKAGVGTTYILAESKRFRPNTMRTYLEPDYFTDEYLRLLRYAFDYAKSVGVHTWLYDEDGWPSGYAGQIVSRKYPYLCRKAIAVDENGNYYRKNIDNLLVVDSLDDEIGKRFVEETHEKLEAPFDGLLGTEIPLIFTDEPGTGMPAYPRNVEEKFLETYGYDMTPFLPALYDAKNANTEEEKKAREDYYMLLGELFRKNYFEPIHDWCKKTGIMSAGHLDLDNQTDGCTRHAYGSVLPLLREMDLPGVDVIWRQIFPPKTKDGAPTKEGNTFFPRFASSAASQTGGRLALTESFAVYGAGLTQDQMRYVVNYQLVRGINVFNFNSTGFSKRSSLPLVCRPKFSAENPGYFHLRAINEYTARASTLMSLGSPAANTALYFPARDLHAGAETKEKAMAAFDALGKLLEEKHIDFDIIDDEGILNAEEKDGCLVLGLAKYSHIAIPECARMPKAVREKAEKYASEPVPVAEVSGESMRLRSRIFENGDMLTFIYNQAGEEASFSMKLPDGAFAALLDANTGAAYPYESLESITLPAGDAASVYTSNTPIPGLYQRKSAVRAIEVRDFSIAKVRETSIEPAGVRTYCYPPAFFPAKTGSWFEYFGKPFSGEAIYRANVSLGFTPEKNAEYTIELGEVKETARVLINGKEAGVAGLTPKCVTVKGTELPESGCFTLEIEVANTLANQTTTKPILDYYPAYERGSYNDYTIPSEQESVFGGLYGPVVIREMK